MDILNIGMVRHAGTINYFVLMELFGLMPPVNQSDIVKKDITKTVGELVKHFLKNVFLLLTGAVVDVKSEEIIVLKAHTTVTIHVKEVFLVKMAKFGILFI